MGQAVRPAQSPRRAPYRRVKRIVYLPHRSLRCLCLDRSPRTFATDLSDCFFLQTTAMATTTAPTSAPAAASDIPAPAAGQGKLSSVVIDPAHAVTVKTVLTMQNPDELSADVAAAKQQYEVTDATGKTHFLLKPPSTTSMTSAAGKKHLYDAQGRPIVDLDKKMVSLHGTWLLTRSADGTRIAEVKPSKKIMNVYLNDGDKQADYTIHGKTKKFTIKDVARANATVATLKKGATGFLPCVKPKTAAEAGKYTLTIQPGVDAAFVTALAMVCENVTGSK